MSDLIKREDALKAIDYRRKTANIDSRIVLDEVEDKIRELPSADAVSREFYEATIKVNHGLAKENIELKEQIESTGRPSGEWVIVNKGLDIYICDQCGEVEQIQRIPIWDYCPNCVAKMKGESDECE